MPDPEEAMKYYENKKAEEEQEILFKKKRQEVSAQFKRLKKIQTDLMRKTALMYADKAATADVIELNKFCKDQLFETCCEMAWIYAFKQLVRETVGENKMNDLIDRLDTEHLDDKILFKIWPYPPGTSS
ncbi:MAG: hypothetical protein IKD83_05570 [Firmicutes bacterium]|nr:hypothetical protein [Bacillota bacterium]